MSSTRQQEAGPFSYNDIVIRQNIIDLAEHYYNADIVRIKTDNIQPAQDIKKIVDAYNPSFFGVVPLSSLKETAKVWLLFSALAFQFKHVTNNGFLSKTYYKGTSGSFGVLNMLIDTYPWTKTADRAVLDALMLTLPLHEHRQAIVDTMLDENNQLFIDTLINDIIDSVKKGVVGIGLAKSLADSLPVAFHDPFLKKAQLAVSSIAQCVVQKEGYPHFQDNLTVFADYEVPRVLKELTILSYSDALNDKINSKQPIAKNSPEELAIRAATVLAVEAMSKKTQYSASTLDHFLWDMQRCIDDSPAHITRTTYY